MAHYFAKMQSVAFTCGNSAARSAVAERFTHLASDKLCLCNFIRSHEIAQILARKVFDPGSDELARAISFRFSVFLIGGCRSARGPRALALGIA